MVPLLRRLPGTAARLGALLALPLFAAPPGSVAEPLDLPWEEAGWTEREAAAHLLDRLAYGPRPGDVDRVVEQGIERWLEGQLRGGLDDPDVEAKLARLDVLDLSGPEMAERFPHPGRLLARARAEGRLDAEDLGDPDDGDARDETRRAVQGLMREAGAEPVFELIRQTWAQKLHRAVSSENQLTEVLVDFWFNHFNVSVTDSQARAWVLAFERDAIRPHVLGDFGSMLGATARHPAMLLYLDNARSFAEEDAVRTFDRSRPGRRGGFASRGGRRGSGPDRPAPDQPGNRDRPSGLNENYARELLELHTLGVDGGYTQEDVLAVARAFTGWTVVPPRDLMREDARRRLERLERRRPPGFVLEESFLFRADGHDAGPKTVLGHRLRAGRGIEDGEEVLRILVGHPSTARHVARKLAVRFVSDEPPASLVGRVAATFGRTGGDLRATLRALLESPEFWDPAARGAKIKSPFELAASAVRALGADVVHPEPLLMWVDRMGQRLYGYQAPTGFPDEAAAWVNTGSLLHRMNFGLQLATGRIPGLEMDLEAALGGREPESLVAALEQWARRLLPERSIAPTVDRLTPVASDPELIARIEAAAPAPAEDPFAFLDDDPSGDAEGASARPGKERSPAAAGRSRTRADRRADATAMPPSGDPGMDRLRRLVAARVPAARPVDDPTTHVVGVILGSPEFQRR